MDVTIFVFMFSYKGRRSSEEEQQQGSEGGAPYFMFEALPKSSFPVAKKGYFLLKNITSNNKFCCVETFVEKCYKSSSFSCKL